MKNIFFLKHSIIIIMLFIMNTSCNEEQIIDPDDQGKSDILTSHQLTVAMGQGFNLGNTFENGINSTSFNDIVPIIDLYANAGMKHIRVPVTWMEPTRFSGDQIADDNGFINTDAVRFKELVKVIDYALDKDLYVVINAHHEHWLKDFYDGSSNYNEKFDNLWTEIASYFKDYSQKLVFEVLNEPEGQLGEWGGDWPSPLSTQALEFTRNVNEIGYDAIRSTGGNNETRLVMVGVNAQGNHNQFDDVYPSSASLPGGGVDKYVAVQLHSYDPWSFCGQTGSNANYPGDASIVTDILNVSSHSTSVGVPVNYGEFGVGRDSNYSERNTDLVRGYYSVFARTAVKQQMSYSVWDDQGWFGLATGSGSNYSFVFDIVPNMLD